MSNLNLMQAHEQWASRPADQRFETLDALRASLRARSMTSREIGDVEAAQLRPIADGRAVKLAVRDADPLSLSHWSFGQLARVSGAPADYLRKLPADLAVSCLAEGLRDGFSGLNGAGKLLVRDDDAGSALAALTSTTYGRIYDHQVADAVAMIQERDPRWHNPLAYDHATGAPRPSGLYASDRDVFCFMIDGGSLLEVGPRAQLNRGFFCWNSETGSRSFGLTTFLFNVVCGNHIVWGASDVRTITIRHSLYAPDRFAGEAGPALLAYANASAAPIEAAVGKACDLLLPEGEKLAAWFADEDLLVVVEQLGIEIG